MKINWKRHAMKAQLALWKNRYPWPLVARVDRQSRINVRYLLLNYVSQIQSYWHEVVNASVSSGFMFRTLKKCKPGRHLRLRNFSWSCLKPVPDVKHARLRKLRNYILPDEKNSNTYFFSVQQCIMVYCTGTYSSFILAFSQGNQSRCGRILSR